MNITPLIIVILCITSAFAFASFGALVACGCKALWSASRYYDAITEEIYSE
jgi:hypothetical protein